MKTVIFKPTYKCNLKCTYCYEAPHRDIANPPMMTENQIIQAFEALFKAYPKEQWEIIWHGGEPSILGIDCIKNVIEHFKDEKIHWGFQTNGTLLNEEWLDFFHEKGIIISTSWDGINNNLTRGSRNFFDLLKRAKEKDVGISAIFTMTPLNAPKALESFQFANDHKFVMIYNVAFGINLSIKEEQEIANYLVEVFDYICKTQECNLFRPFNEILDYLDFKEPFYCESKNCCGAWFGIDPEGNIIPCGKPWGKEAILANVFSDKDNLYETIENAPFRKILLNARLQQMDDCKNCDYLLVCHGKCPFTGFNGLNYEKDLAQCAYNKTFFSGCLDALENNLKNNTLINERIIQSIQNTGKSRFIKWKNYKSPII